MIEELVARPNITRYYVANVIKIMVQIEKMLMVVSVRQLFAIVKNESKKREPKPKKNFLI
jgi:hypothetical protein